MRSFGESIYTYTANLVEINNKSWPRTKEGKAKKEMKPMKVHMLFMSVKS